MLATNGITSVSSSSTSDTQTITLLEGHTVADGNLTFSANSSGITLTGRTAVTLPAALRNATRARLSSPAQGTIYFHEGGPTTNGVPDDLTEVHLVIPQGEMQTQRGQTAVSSVDYWIITGGSGSVLSKTSHGRSFASSANCSRTHISIPLRNGSGSAMHQARGHWSETALTLHMRLSQPIMTFGSLCRLTHLASRRRAGSRGFWPLYRTCRMGSARGRKPGFVMSHEHRVKIQNSNILNALIEHVEGRREMSATQVSAGLGLLKKIMPDLAASADVGDAGELVSVNGMSDAELEAIAAGGSAGVAQKTSRPQTIN